MWVSAPPNQPISDRELEVIESFLDGHETSQEVAEALGVADSTVKNHLHSLYAKLGVTRLAGALLVCIQQGIIRLPVEGVPHE